MSCSSIEKLLPGLVDDSLNDDEKVLVEKHLASCTTCCRNLEKLRKTMDLMHNLKEVEPPPWYTQKIMSQVRQESVKWGILDKLREFFTFKTRVMVFATVCIAVLSMFLYRAILSEQAVVNPEPHQTMADAGPRQGPSVEVNPVHTLPEKAEPKAGPSRMKEDKLSVEKIAERPAHEPSLQGKGYSGVPEHIAEKSSGSGKQGLLPTPPVIQENEVNSSLQQGRGPLLTEAASNRPALHMLSPVEISLAVNDLAASSEEVDRILKKLNIKITKYQVLESSEFYNAEVKSQDLKTPMDYLKKLGDLKSKNLSINRGTESVKITTAIKMQ